MLYITLNSVEIPVQINRGEIILSGISHTLDLIQINSKQYHILHRGQSFTVFLEQFNEAEKWIQLRINGRRKRLQILTETDRRIKDLGFTNTTVKQISDLRAPMPGLILSVLVKEGDSVKKGDVVFILEAMKMENALKAPQDSTIKHILVQKGQTVEKNQMLLQW